MSSQLRDAYENTSTKVLGGTIRKWNSCLDPYGWYSIECEKHPGKQIKIDFLWSMEGENTLIDMAHEALKKCEGCVEIKTHLSSRWPNAGEPGGAEL